MVATGKSANYQVQRIFISVSLKKQEAESSKYIDYVIDFQQLKELFAKNNISMEKEPLGKVQKFNCLYNDYTKIYPLAGGLSKTANLRGIIENDEVKIIDGINEVKKYLDKYKKKPDKKIRFLDVNFCVGGCLGGLS